MANTKKTADTKTAKTELNKENTATAEVVENTDIVDAADDEMTDNKAENANAVDANETASSINELTAVIESCAPGGIVDKAGTVNRKIDPSRVVEVMSVTFGGLTWISEKTKSHYRWNSIGDIENMTFDELVVMHNMSRDFLFTPYVIVRDPEVAEYFRLNAVYKEFAYVNKLEALFDEGDMGKIEEALNKIKRTNMRNVAISKIRALKESGKLTNIYIIRLIQKILCFDLDDIT
ncbi:MAG: hypothetical protein NC299_18460 [Lachnospiraceae bacterium]|nr:hypothetical protein [Lachnospiraceae bacterium]